MRLSKNRIVPESFTTMQHHAARGTCKPLSVKGYIGYKMKQQWLGRKTAQYQISRAFLTHCQQSSIFRSPVTSYNRMSPFFRDGGRTRGTIFIEAILLRQMIPDMSLIQWYPVKKDGAWATPVIFVAVGRREDPVFVESLEAESMIQYRRI